MQEYDIFLWSCYNALRGLGWNGMTEFRSLTGGGELDGLQFSHEIDLRNSSVGRENGNDPAIHLYDKDGSWKPWDTLPC